MDDFEDFIGGALTSAAPKSDLQSEMRAFARFRRALRREDQEALDHLLVSVKDHWEAQCLAPHLTPIEFTLLAMLLEQSKEVSDLQEWVEEQLEGRI